MLAFLSYKNNLLENYFISEILKKQKKILIFKESKYLKYSYSYSWKLQTEGFFDCKIIQDKKRVNFIEVPSHNSKLILKYIKNYKIKYLINLGTTSKISEKILKSLKYGIVNCHPGLIPYYRGSQCVEWAIYNDEPIYLTAHYMTKEYDLGKIIKTKKITTRKLKSYSEIRIKVYKKHSELICEILKNFEILKNKNLSIRNKKYFIKKPKIYKKMNQKKINEIVNKVKNKKYLYQ